METMKIQLLVLCLMALVVLTIQRGPTCDKNRYINGCSVPKGIKISFKQRFKPACNKHDLCYRCMTVYGLSRLQCDKRFRTNMKRICKRLGGKNFIDKFLKRESCKKHADIYYGAVRVGGEKAIKNKGKKPSWCRQKWVKPCMK